MSSGTRQFTRFLAVFRDGGDQWYARFLKPGFQHVFTAIDDGAYWIVLDGHAGLPHFHIAAESEFDLAAYYAKQGFRVVELRGIRRSGWFPLMRADCLGAAKKMLGLNAWYIFTPYQLYCRLRRM